MDDIVNRFARELAEAIATAVAESSEVEVCREKVRAAGFEMRVTLEATIGFAQRTPAGEGKHTAKAARETPARRPVVDITAYDRRVLRSLRIAADETPEEVN